jgi:uncharacterized protein DUF6265
MISTPALAQRPSFPAVRLGFLTLFLAAAPSFAQTPAAAPAEDPLEPLAWLDGCWRGAVNQREFREQWMPLRGGLLLGVSHTVMGGKSQGYEYLRIESRPDGIYYVALPSGDKEDAFKYTGKAIDTSGDRNDELFTFENPALEFPRRIVYRRATGGWLYAQVEGKVNGADRQVIYPMRRIDCATGAVISK